MIIRSIVGIALLVGAASICSSAFAEDALAPPAETAAVSSTPSPVAPPAGDMPDAPTVEDQSQSADDIRITQTIRKALMADDSISFGAKNTAVITAGGRVTLRGRVNESERSAIVRHAETAAPGQVEDLLETERS